MITILLFVTTLTTNSKPTILTTSQWTEDIKHLVSRINEVHPNPYKNISQKQFENAVNKLIIDLDHLDDKDIVVRMATIVSLIKDGHTRLTFPKMNTQLGLSIGHSTNKDVFEEELKFTQLPLLFDVFEDGVFVVSAESSYAKYLGAKILQIGNQKTSQVLDSLKSVAFAENQSAEKLKAADRISYPNILSALGIIEHDESVPMHVLMVDGSTKTINLKPLTKKPVSFVDAFGENKPLYMSDHNSHYFAHYLKEKNIVYVVINEIGNADDGPSLGHFFQDQVNLAEKENAKLVIDLRFNFGGSGSYNRSIILSLLKSEEINQYGRSFVIIGRRTFSAAQMLLNELERYTNITFVGEPSGSRPDHYGDSKKTQLKHSGLTLRVSSLHWSSWSANDSRLTTTPLFYTPWTSENYFAGNDPALKTIDEIKPSLTINEVLKLAFANDDEYLVYRYLHNLQTSSNYSASDLADSLLTIGQHYQQIGGTSTAKLIFQYGNYYFPKNLKFQQALETI